MSAAPQVNIVSAEFKANPFPPLATLRASEPVYRTALPDKTPVWLLTRYEDVNPLLSAGLPALTAEHDSARDGFAPGYVLRLAVSAPFRA